jgi:hypothetical protein
MRYDMIHPTTSLEEFARTGKLGPLALGMTRGQVVQLVGRPSDFSAHHPEARATVWRYGNAELHFNEEDRIWLFHFDDGFDVPRGGSGLLFEPWVLKEKMTREVLEQSLKSVGIGFRTSADPHNPGCVKIVTSSGVYFLLGIEGPCIGRGLLLFGASAGRS